MTGRDPEELLKEHLAVEDAVTADEQEEAERLARLHVSRSAESILEQNV